MTDKKPGPPSDWMQPIPPNPEKPVTVPRESAPWVGKRKAPRKR